MLFIFSMPVLIKHLRQLKTVVFLHWSLICVVLMFVKLKLCQRLWSLFVENTFGQAARARVLLQIWSHFVVLCKANFDVQQTELWSWFVKHKLKLGWNFKRKQCYEFSHTLLYWLSITKFFNKLAPEASLPNRSSGLATALGVTKIIAFIAMN